MNHLTRHDYRSRSDEGRRRLFPNKWSETIRVRIEEIKGRSSCPCRRSKIPFTVEIRSGDSWNNWLNAEYARDLVAMTCVSLLFDALKLYFEAVRARAIGFDFGGRCDEVFREGFAKAHLGVLGGILETDWSDCPADVGCN